MKQLRSYHFSCGNSTKGPVGFCARVKAHSKKEAVEILEAWLPSEMDIEQTDDARIEYGAVYFGPITPRMIDEVNDAEEDDDPDKCTECGEDNTGGDGYDGLCGNCADKAERRRA